MVALQTWHHFFGLLRNTCSKICKTINNCCEGLTAICWHKFSGPSWSATIAPPSFEQFNGHRLNTNPYEGSRQMKRLKTDGNIQFRHPLLPCQHGACPSPQGYRHKWQTEQTRHQTEQTTNTISAAYALRVCLESL